MSSNVPPWSVTMYGAAPWPESPRVPDPFAPQTFPCVPDPAAPATAGTFVIQPPPPYAPKTELELLDALEKLPEEQRRRVLRYALDKWPTAEVEALKKRLVEAEATAKQCDVLDRTIDGLKAQLAQKLKRRGAKK